MLHCPEVIIIRQFKSFQQVPSYTSNMNAHSMPVGLEFRIDQLCLVACYKRPLKGGDTE